MRYYEGAIKDLGVQELERTIDSDAALLRAVQNDWFLSLYWSGLYGLKPNDFRLRTAIRLPVVPYKLPVAYYATREIVKQHTENKSLVINCKGSTDAGAADEASLLNLDYDLYHSDFSICSITGSVVYATTDFKKHVAIEVFHLREKD